MKIMKGDIGRTKKMSFPIHVMTLMNLVSLPFCEGGIWKRELHYSSAAVFVCYETKLIYL